MKTFITCPGRLAEYKPEFPERTATKATGLFGEVITVKVWPSRAALAETIKMQRKRERRPDDWRPWVAFGW